MKRKNDQIESRNKARLQFARALESPDIALRRKVGTTTSVVIQMCRNCGITPLKLNAMQLLSARDMAQKTVIGKERIVYSTERDMTEQNYEADEWDRRFREVDKSD